MEGGEGGLYPTVEHYTLLIIIIYLYIGQSHPITKNIHPASLTCMLSSIEYVFENYWCAFFSGLDYFVAGILGSVFIICIPHTTLTNFRKIYYYMEMLCDNVNRLKQSRVIIMIMFITCHKVFTQAMRLLFHVCHSDYNDNWLFVVIELDTFINIKKFFLRTRATNSFELSQIQKLTLY